MSNQNRYQATDYDLLISQIEALAEISRETVPVLANAAALLFDALPDINWAGFYLVNENARALLLGPFQGKPACVKIEKGKGVCGTAWAQDEVQLVADVHAFPGHIACDAASNSEIVVPLHRMAEDKCEVIGVLDIDSPVFGRFTQEDKEGLVQFAECLERIMV
jgi:GAF domain-containing protein